MRSLALFAVLLLATSLVVAKPGRKDCDRRRGGMKDMIEKIGMMMSGIPKLIKYQKDKMGDMQNPMFECLKNEYRACLDFELPEKYFKITHECMMMHMPTLGVKSMITKDLPEKRDFMKLKMAVIQCKLEAMNLVNDKGIYVLKKWKEELDKTEFSGKDGALVKIFLSNCTDEAASSTPSTSMMENVQIISIIDKCFARKMMEKCGNQISYSYPISYSLQTFADEPKCSAVEVPKKVEETMIFCITKTADEFTESDKIDLIKSLAGNGKKAIGDVIMAMSEESEINPMNTIKEVMAPLKKHIKECHANILKCFLEELDFLDESNNLDTIKYRNYYKGFSGWDNTIRDKFDAQVEQCYKDYNIDVVNGKVDISSSEKLDKLGEVCIKCKLPALAEHCGMDNSVTEFFFPITNRNIAKHFLATIKEKLPTIKEMKELKKLMGKSRGRSEEED